MDILIFAIIILSLMALLFGGILGFAAKFFAVDANPVVDQINQLLPQTQCGQCGHPGCKPYAQAIANNQAAINLCPPGGEATIHALASLLDVEPLPLDAEQGMDSIKRVAYIREDECIGCTKCIKACPVDAILGAAKLMHTVIVKECTGCDLCVEPCPVDCIDMIPVNPTPHTWHWNKPGQLIASDRAPLLNQNVAKDNLA